MIAGRCARFARVWHASARPLASTNVLRLHNSLTGKLEPLNDSTTAHELLTWYQCGPTVYDHAHLGHARTYVAFDILRRVMESHFNLNLFTAMGVTDVDDKTIKRSALNGESPLTLARRMEASFMADMAALGVQPPHTLLRVSEHVNSVVEMVRQILDRGFGYVAKDGVYFDVQAFQKAGHSYNTLRSALFKPAELPPDSTKRSSEDFALWKLSREAEPEEVRWPSPWGVGRPGWHIECSAMCSTLFGDTLDLHSGGVDLKFPHHNNEIAQCHATRDGQWCGHWLHAGHVRIAGQKMAKSLKNFTTVSEFMSEFSSDVFRMFVAQCHYRGPVEYTQERMHAASSVLSGFLDFFSASAAAQRAHHSHLPCDFGPTEHTLLTALSETTAACTIALSEDMDTASVVRQCQQLIKQARLYLSSSVPNVYLLHAVTNFVHSRLTLLGLQLPSVNTNALRPHSAAENLDTSSSLDASALVNAFLTFRGDIRSSAGKLMKKYKASEDIRPSDFGELLKKCDEVRDKTLSELNVVARDTREGFEWREALGKVDTSAPSAQFSDPHES